MVNKKGAEFTITTLIVIVLAIIVLVVLALGFGAGWSNLWSKITGFFSPVNVDATKQACQYACTSQSNFAYCCQIREVRFEKGQTPESMTCDDPKIGPEDCDFSCNIETMCSQVLCKGDFKTTCDADTESENTAGKIKSTGDVIQKNEKCCELKTTSKTCQQLGGNWKAVCTGNEEDKKSEVSDAESHTQQKCCVPKSP